MARKLGVFTFVMLLGVAVAGSAATQAKPQAQKPGAAKVARATTLTASGKVVKFDAASNTLTVSTNQGEQQFMLNSTARITEGQKSVTASQLGTLTDRQVQVRYTESEGHKMASSVRIGGAPKAQVAAAPKATKTPKKG